MSDVLDFVRGQEDCQKGEPHKEGQSDSYNQGYELEYQMGVILDARTSD